MTPTAPNIQSHAAFLTSVSVEELRDLLWMAGPTGPAADDPWSEDVLCAARDRCRDAGAPDRLALLQAELDRQDKVAMARDALEKSQRV